MKTRKIGEIDVTTVGVGCNNFGWQIDDKAAQQVVDAAIDCGINHFDTAELYGDGASEKFLSKALGKRRQNVIIATKYGYDTGAHAENIKSSVEGSLKRLATDYIDIYYLHRPDPKTPISETLGEMSRLVEAGKVREIACSGFSAEQIREAADVNTSSSFRALQNEYSLLFREPETDQTLELCARKEIGFVPYFPLKSGLLTGKYRKSQQPPGDSRLGSKEGYFSSHGNRLLTESNLDIIEKLIEFASGRDHTTLELAFSYLLAQPMVSSVIAGATKPSQIKGNAKATDWELTEEEIAEVQRILDEHS